MELKMSMQCGYCYGWGHTKMGCPEAKNIVDKNLKAYKKLKAQEPGFSLWKIICIIMTRLRGNGLPKKMSFAWSQASAGGE